MELLLSVEVDPCESNKVTGCGGSLATVAAAVEEVPTVWGVSPAGPVPTSHYSPFAAVVTSILRDKKAAIKVRLHKINALS